MQGQQARMGIHPSTSIPSSPWNSSWRILWGGRGWIEGRTDSLEAKDSSDEYSSYSYSDSEDRGAWTPLPRGSRRRRRRRSRKGEDEEEEEEEEKEDEVEEDAPRAQQSTSAPSGVNAVGTTAAASLGSAAHLYALLGGWDVGGATQGWVLDLSAELLLSEPEFVEWELGREIGDGIDRLASPGGNDAVVDAMERGDQEAHGVHERRSDCAGAARAGQDPQG
eukprot:9340346-Pyramimonas_sp.AAC.1